MIKNILFWKVEAAGNDFVMVDNRENNFDCSNKGLIAKMCHRRFGIGADGLIEIFPDKGYDFKMKYYNSDGSGPVMCGNGARAAVYFAHYRGYLSSEKINFMAPDGEHLADMSNKNIRLTIKQPETLELTQESEPVYFVDTGTNHIVLKKSNLYKYNIRAEGAYYRKKYDSNVNFVEEIRQGEWKIRTWERGVEDETYACGTGATASAFMINKIDKINFPISMFAKGGKLIIDKVYTKLWLEGPTNFVFEGKWKYKE